MLRIGIKRIVWLSQMKQSVYHSAWNIFIFVLRKNFRKKNLLVKAILFKSLMQYGATIFKKKPYSFHFFFSFKYSLYLSAYWIHSLWHHCQQWKISRLSKGWHTYLCMRRVEVSSVAKNAGDVGNLIFRESWEIYNADIPPNRSNGPLF